MNERIATLEAKFESVIPTLATKSDMGELRADVHKISSDISRWTLATMVTIIGAVLAAVIGISQIYKNASTATPTAQAPIIINVPSSVSPSTPAAPTK